MQNHPTQRRIAVAFDRVSELARQAERSAFWATLPDVRQQESARARRLRLAARRLLDTWRKYEQ